MRSVLSAFGHDLRYVFRYLPLADVHEHAQLAAEAAEAAARQGKFWEMYDLLFTHQDALSLDDLLRYAAALVREALAQPLVPGAAAMPARCDEGLLRGREPPWRFHESGKHPCPHSPTPTTARPQPA